MCTFFMIEVEFSYLEKRLNWNWHQKKEIIELENQTSKREREIQENDRKSTEIKMWKK